MPARMRLSLLVSASIFMEISIASSTALINIQISKCAQKPIIRCFFCENGIIYNRFLLLIHRQINGCEEVESINIIFLSCVIVYIVFEINCALRIGFELIIYISDIIEQFGISIDSLFVQFFWY